MAYISDTKQEQILREKGVIISLLVSFLFIRSTSRTFNGYDIGKVLLMAGVLTTVLYYFFYLYDAYMVLGSIQKYKEKQNKAQADFWKRTGIDKKRFYNDLHQELGKYYYEQPSVIDFDILDCTSLKESLRTDGLYITACLDVRVVSLNAGKISAKYHKDTVTLKKSGKPVKLAAGINVIKCPSCNANVDLSLGKCGCCGTKFPNEIQCFTLVPQ